MKPFDCARELLDRGVTLLEARVGTGKLMLWPESFWRLVVEEGWK